VGATAAARSASLMSDMYTYNCIGAEVSAAPGQLSRRKPALLSAQRGG
jgi:hypothetical protein